MKHKAFTIIELLVAMLISSIVITASIGIYLTLKELSFRYNEQYRNNAAIINLAGLIKADIDNACFIREGFGGIYLDMNNENRIYYSFEDSRIVRKINFQLDTFYLKNRNIEVENLEAGSGLIENIKFEILYGDSALRFYFHKEYMPDILFKLYREQK
ncbi:MAG: prepilin-type N-terminal cleavage/methylation domain-containing protein [Bacteroidia bacterium]|nr:prepilin-type N-terminal cleavage/methylation domain-containing protein [Bacteroidia bacterium]